MPSWGAKFGGLFKALEGEARLTANIPVTGDTAGLIEKTLRESLPPAMYKALAESGWSYHVISTAEMPESMGQKTHGLTDPLRRQVYLDSAKTNPATIAHETGHVIDFQLGSMMWEKATQQHLLPPLAKGNPEGVGLQALIMKHDQAEYGGIASIGTLKGFDQFSRPASVFNSSLFREYQPNIAMVREAEGLLKDSAAQETFVEEIQKYSAPLVDKYESSIIAEQTKAIAGQPNRLSNLQKEMQKEVMGSAPPNSLLSKVYAAGEKRTSVSEYGSTNALENFAENFRTYQGLAVGGETDAFPAADRPMGTAFQKFIEDSTGFLESGKVPQDYQPVTVARQDPLGAIPGVGAYMMGGLRQSQAMTRYKKFRPFHGTRPIQRNGFAG